MEINGAFVEERVNASLAEHKQQMLKEMESMFMKISASSQSKLSSQIASSSTLKFRRKSNEEQYKVNVDIMGKIEDAERSLSEENMEESRQNISSAKSLLQHRQKMIKLADAFDLGWKVVSEYETNPLASDSDDEKRMHKAEARANRKVRADRAKKARTPRYNPYRRTASSPQDRKTGGFDPVQATGTARRIPPGLCFACGKPGHWKGALECAANISNNKISSYFITSAICHVSSADMESDTGELILNKKFKGVKSVMNETRKESESTPEVQVKMHPDDVVSNPKVSEMQGASAQTSEEVVTPVGRLRSCYEKWESVSSSEYIRNVIKEGYKLPFRDIPEGVILSNNRSARENPDFVRSEISSLLKKEIISEVDEIPYVVNPLTVAYGKSGKPRLVLDCRHINPSLHLFKVKFEDVEVAKQIFAKNTFMFTFDLKGAYHHVNIFQEHRIYLGFSYPDGNTIKYYYFNSLPFGIRTAGHIFTKLLKVVVAYIRSYSHRVVMFLDDGIGGHTDYVLAVNSSQFVKRTVMEFGFLLANEKCCWEPSMNVAWLGHVLDMVNNRVFISEERICRLEIKLDSIIKQIESSPDKIVPVRFLASVVGQIISLQSVIGSIARLRTRESFKCINTRASWNAPVKVTSEVMSELLFWRGNAKLLNDKGCHLKKLVACDFNLFVDASSIGYGGYLEPIKEVCNSQVFQGVLDTDLTKEIFSLEVESGGIPEAIHSHAQGIKVISNRSPDEDKTLGNGLLDTTSTEVVGSWSQGERLLSSTWREAEAVRRVLCTYRKELRGSCVKVFSDNKNVKSVLMHGSSKTNLQNIALKTRVFCEESNITICPDWIPREDNERADHLSRCVDSDDWEVSSRVFCYLDSIWGPHTIDRFASHMNTKCTRFNSRWWVPGTESVDAFSQNWSGETNWIVPPPRVIPLCLEKVAAERAACTLIVPKWKSAPFWPLLSGGNKCGLKHQINLGRLQILEKGRGNNGIFSLNPLPFDMLALKFG